MKNGLLKEPRRVPLFPHKEVSQGQLLHCPFFVKTKIEFPYISDPNHGYVDRIADRAWGASDPRSTEAIRKNF